MYTAHDTVRIIVVSALITAVVMGIALTSTFAIVHHDIAERADAKSYATAYSRVQSSLPIVNGLADQKAMQKNVLANDKCPNVPGVQTNSAPLIITGDGCFSRAAINKAERDHEALRDWYAVH